MNKIKTKKNKHSLLTLLIPFLILIVLIANIYVLIKTDNRVITLAPKKTINDEFENESMLEKFMSLPYMAYTKEKMAENESGVTIYDLKRAYPGYNLYDNILMDMEGNIVKEWVDMGIVNLLDDMNMIAYDVGNDSKVGFYSWNGTPYWEADIHVHHDTTRSDNGNFLVITKEVHRYKNRDVEFDVVVEFSPEGKELSRWSTYEKLDYLKQFWPENPLEIPADSYDPNCNKSEFGGCFDYYHLNSIQTLPETELGKTDKRFQKGNWLINPITTESIIILDKDTKEIVWIWGQGVIHTTHIPRMLKSGNILIYENDFIFKDDQNQSHTVSRILELDPVSGKIVGEYTANPPKSFCSLHMGSVQLLPNGNLFILDADSGRAFEVADDMSIVWEWFNPTRNEEGQRETAYRMFRLPKDKVDEMLKKYPEAEK